MKRDLLLRIGLAFVFLYPAIDSFLVPQAWIGYFPAFMHGIVPDMVLLSAWAIVEIIIALWVLWGKYLFIPTALATIMLVLIVVFNISLLEIVFRDLGLATIALTLAIRSYPGRRIRLGA